MGEMGAGGGATARVTDHRGEITDDENRLVAEFLELPQLGEAHRMTEMDIGRCWIDPQFHTQGSPQRELGLQLLFTENLGAASKKGGKLIGRRYHGTVQRITFRELC